MKKISVKKLALVQKAFYILAAVFAIASFMNEVKGEPRPLLWVAGIFIVLSFVWRIVFVKCPNCGDALAADKKIPDICPICGFDLVTNTPKEENNGQAD